VTGRVDDVDREISDSQRRDCGSNRDAPLTLQRERICLGGTGVNTADLIDDPSGKEQPLGQGCLTGIDMRQDPQVERTERQTSQPSNERTGDIRK
jgi:hypothetical protein